MLLAHPYAICLQRLGSMYCVSTFDMEPSLNPHTGRRKCPACVRFGIFLLVVLVVRGIINGSVNLPVSFLPLPIAIPARDLQEYPSLNTGIIPWSLEGTDKAMPSQISSFLSSSLAVTMKA